MPAPISKLAELRRHLRATAQVIESQHPASEVPGSFEGFVLKNGRSYRSSPLTAKERAIVDVATARRRGARRSFEKRRCFENSQHLMMADDSGKLVYVEGFAWTHSLLPVLHGWLVLNGKVIDVTLPPTTRPEARLREPKQVLGEFDGRSYLGVPFRHEFVLERIVVVGLGSLLDDEEHGYPVLVEGGVDRAVRRGR